MKVWLGGGGGRGGEEGGQSHTWKDFISLCVFLGFFHLSPLFDVYF